MSRQQQRQASALPDVRTKRGFLARLLDPVDRLVEAIYSILIVLIFL